MNVFTDLQLKVIQMYNCYNCILLEFAWTIVEYAEKLMITGDLPSLEVHVIHWTKHKCFYSRILQKDF